MAPNRSKAAIMWMMSGIVVLTSPVWGQSTPPIQNGQVEVVGAVPRTTDGGVDVEALKQTIQAQFARPGVREIQFRNVGLTEEERRTLFLNGDPNKNLLRQVSTVVPSPNGEERNVTFRSNDFRARVGREEGQLRARIEGIDATHLTATERQHLRSQFDRFRLEGANDRGGNRADNRGGRGGVDHSGPGSLNSGPGSVNSGAGSLGSGRGGQDDTRVAQAGDMRQEDRRADRREDRRLDRREDRREDRRDNRGGEVRGLDRADQVAGDHGQQGRETARMMQIDRPNRPERVERPQRPERPERPQRPERPERPERAGRN